MPPVILLLLRSFTLLLILAKTIVGINAVSKHPQSRDDIPYKTLIQILASISLLFSVYFMLLSSASFKGAAIFGAVQLVHEAIAFLMFLTSAISDIALILFTAGPQNVILFTKTILWMTSSLFASLIIVYFIAVYRLNNIIKTQIAKDSN